MTDNVVVLPVVRIERAWRAASPQMDLLKRIGWAIDDCIDDEHPGIARILEEAKAEIIRLNSVTSNNQTSDGN